MELQGIMLGEREWSLFYQDFQYWHSGEFEIHREYFTWRFRRGKLYLAGEFWDENLLDYKISRRQLVLSTEFEHEEGEHETVSMTFRRIEEE
jgi:hypothetical protein